MMAVVAGLLLALAVAFGRYGRRGRRRQATRATAPVAAPLPG
jgi:hypothetical protein